MDKKLLRTQVRHSLQKIDAEQFELSSLNIKKLLFREPSIIKGKTIAITISNKQEVDTKKIIESLWQLKKKVVVPKCNSKDRSMKFYEIEHFNQLENVYMDLQEPNPECTQLVHPEEIDCIIVPGIVFDKKGYRIGYGGGYYDRYLSRFDGMLISLAFNLQVIDDVPKESFDIPVDLLITETETIDCLQNRKELNS
ncbi:5-formyltetrahydrofolate cyclo-ligase [Ureibacillus chungkukjangi]|uniref:5-formyltetrahydrofolate cyclo-ligase n=1 Tax=Ureibacillus chungkukjangi TaxID=1202712 RepID=UPI00203A9F01|nr:5-formyltetrahydrofolate cyclo-ligase [Ureibacillus chungkukjangi]MCM3389942.1 5-formyltetrahydrofolate cyclo-ligase [Ureibacillus chungkukjangi]